MGPAVAAAIGPAVGAITGLINAGSQRRENRRQRDFIVDRYNVERTDAIADWNRQNEYNLPANQRKRLIQAGLNPALMYGQGAGSGGNAQSARGTTSGSYKGEAPKLSILEFASLRKLGAETKILDAEAKLKETEATEAQRWLNSDISATDYNEGKPAFGKSGYEAMKMFREIQNIEKQSAYTGEQTKDMFWKSKISEQSYREWLKNGRPESWKNDLYYDFKKWVKSSQGKSLIRKLLGI